MVVCEHVSVLITTHDLYEYLLLQYVYEYLHNDELLAVTNLIVCFGEYIKYTLVLICLMSANENY